MTDEEKLIKDFKKRFYRKMGYLPIVIGTQLSVKDAPFMSLEKLETYFEPFLPSLRNGKVLRISAKQRNREIVDLRIIFSYLARTMGYSLCEIGKYTNKHHSTVINHLDVFKALVETSDKFRDKYRTVIKHIKIHYKNDDKLSTMVYIDKI
jgi:hypothetical protein